MSAAFVRLLEGSRSLLEALQSGQESARIQELLRERGAQVQALCDAGELARLHADDWAALRSLERDVHAALQRARDEAAGELGRLRLAQAAAAQYGAARSETAFYVDRAS